MRVLVVGASSSVGGPLVDRFVARGDAVVATSHRRPFARDGVRTVSLDLLVPGAITEFVESLGDGGAFDAVVMLAATLPGLSLADYDDDLARTVMTLNVTAPAMLTRALLPRMAPSGQVIFLSSVAGERGSFDPFYAASKSALFGLVRSLAAWHPGVRFNCVAPSLIEGSTMFHAMTEARQAHHRARAATGTLLDLDDLARVIVDLTEPHWKHLNGAVLSLHGGLLP